MGKPVRARERERTSQWAPTRVGEYGDRSRLESPAVATHPLRRRTVEAQPPNLRQWSSRERPTWTGSPEGEETGVSKSISAAMMSGSGRLALSYRLSSLKWIDWVEVTPNPDVDAESVSVSQRLLCRRQRFLGRGSLSATNRLLTGRHTVWRWLITSLDVSTHL
jgi:hypothetical protein